MTGLVVRGLYIGIQLSLTVSINSTNSGSCETARFRYFDNSFDSIYPYSLMETYKHDV